MKITNKCNWNKKNEACILIFMTLRGCYGRWIATLEYTSSKSVETNVLITLCQDLSARICNWLPCEMQILSMVPFQKRHKKFYIYEFQETVFKIVQQVMVSPGSRKRQGQNRYTSVEQYVLFFSLGIKNCSVIELILNPLGKHIYFLVFFILSFKSAFISQKLTIWAVSFMHASATWSKKIMWFELIQCKGN